ncbi:hypothetical protein Lal_00043604 [Lupinus albus]|nr:hypothetical protein Lal_00043604 [Lupinus albus]
MSDSRHASKQDGITINNDSVDYSIFGIATVPFDITRKSLLEASIESPISRKQEAALSYKISDGLDTGLIKLGTAIGHEYPCLRKEEDYRPEERHPRHLHRCTEYHAHNAPFSVETTLAARPEAPALSGQAWDAGYQRLCDAEHHGRHRLRHLHLSPCAIAPEPGDWAKWFLSFPHIDTRQFHPAPDAHKHPPRADRAFWDSKSLLPFSENSRGRKLRWEFDMAHVVVYSGPFCPFCTKAKALLDRKGVAYDEYNVREDEAKLQEMLEKSNGKKTIPQIFIDDRHIGGCDDLYALDGAGKLDALLA